MCNVRLAMTLLSARGRIEAWLDPQHDDQGDTIIRYACVFRDGSRGWTAGLVEAFVAPDVSDVVELPFVDPDQPWSQERSFATAGEALRYACEELGAGEDSFLEPGELQAKYDAALRKLDKR